MGEDNRAIEEMKKAISNARGTGFKRLFLDEGQAVLEMLRVPEIRACAPRLVDGLLEKPDVSQPKESVSAQPLPEALSERELEVLRYLRTNLTTPEIAEEMVLGVNTVRTHIKNIYSKLNVHKRWDAVQRAEELGLL